VAANSLEAYEYGMSTLKCLLTYILTYLLTYLHTYLLTYLHTYILTYMHTYVLTYIHTYLLTYYLLTAVELSLGGSSPYTSTDKINKNKYT